jgi:putative Holliday junction resolvase
MMDNSQGRPRILAIDFGTKRLGLAISDPLGITAQGLPTRERTRLEDDLRYVESLAAEHSVERVIVGNPLSHTGGSTAMSERAGSFAEKLRKRLGCAVELWDERMTSVEANRVLRESGIGIEKRRRAVDRVAATLLLHGYLDYQANQRARGTDRAERSNDESRDGGTGG